MDVRPSSPHKGIGNINTVRQQDYLPGNEINQQQLPFHGPAISMAGSFIRQPQINRPEANGQQQKSRRIACRDCRQAKLRCDVSRDGRAACTRCRRLSLECQVDLNYKRVNKRLKIRELAQQLEELRSSINRQDTNEMSQNQSPSALQDSCSPRNPRMIGSPQFEVADEQIQRDDSQHSQERSANVANVFVETSKSSQRHQHTTVSKEGLRQPFFTAQKARSLDHIALDQQQISELFQGFFTYYHQFLDILDPNIPPDIVYTRSPLLFWAIISVAARRYEEDPALFTTLGPCVTKLLWQCISAQPHSRFTVQALLLISIWSFPTNSLSTDTSFMLVSIAKAASIQLGLHRPEAVQDFSRVRTHLGPEEFQEIVKTWAGCYIAAQSITGTIGFPTVLPDDWAINRACELGNKYTLPKDFRHHLLIYKFFSRVNRVMAGNICSATGHPAEVEQSSFMTLLECDFEDLERHIGDQEVSMVNQITLLITRLQLLCYYFFVTSAPEFRKEGLIKAYSTSLVLVNKIQEVDAKWDFVRYAPTIFTRMLTVAALLQMKIVNSSYSKYIDSESGKGAFAAVIAMLGRASLEINDLHDRVRRIMEQLWVMHHSLVVKRSQEPSLNVKSRLGASVLHDSLWMWREEFGGQGSATVHERQDNISIQPHVPPLLNTAPSASVQSNEQMLQGDISASQTASRQTLQDASYVSGVNLGNLGAEYQDMDWLWDANFPSLLPLDLDSWEMPMQNS